MTVSVLASSTPAYAPQTCDPVGTTVTLTQTVPSCPLSPTSLPLSASPDLPDVLSEAIPATSSTSALFDLISLPLSTSYPSATPAETAPTLSADAALDSTSLPASAPYPSYPLWNDTNAWNKSTIRPTAVVPPFPSEGHRAANCTHRNATATLRIADSPGSGLLSYPASRAFTTLTRATSTSSTGVIVDTANSTLPASQAYTDAPASGTPSAPGAPSPAGISDSASQAYAAAPPANTDVGAATRAGAPGGAATTPAPALPGVASVLSAPASIRAGPAPGQTVPAPAPMCAGFVGYDRDGTNVGYYVDAATATYGGCLALCRSRADCLSFGVTSVPACILYDYPVVGNDVASPGSGNTFYDRGCAAF